MITLEDVLSRLSNVRKSGAGYSARCPVHGDRRNSLSVKESDKGLVLLHCFVGCTYRDIMSALGLSSNPFETVLASFSTPVTQQPAKEAPVARTDSETAATVTALASHKHLPESFLRQTFGLDDRIDEKGQPYIHIPHWNADGSPASRHQRRTGLNGKSSYWSPGDKEITLYGLNLLDNSESLILCEGPSDIWALTYHGFSALGIPGANMAGKLQIEHVSNRKRLFVHQEPDAGGEAFVKGMARQLREIGWTGSLFKFSIAGVKDPSELHILSATDFKSKIANAIAHAEPVATYKNGDVVWQDENPWPTLSDDALHGLAGEIIKVLAPHTEADHAAMLLQFLTMFGNAVGGIPRVEISADEHPARLSVLVVGNTSYARKGMGLNENERLFRAADETWFDQAYTVGLASGEGLASKCKDVDGDISEKKALVIEYEFSRLLAVAGREGMILSQNIRAAWDGKPIGSTKAKDSTQARHHFVSLIGHVTQADLLHSLSSTEIANGFANRILFCCSKRSKKLSRGGKLDFRSINPLVEQIKSKLEFARGLTTQTGRLTFSDEAGVLWDQLYDQGFPEGASLADTLRARGPTQTLRLAVAYALLDGSHTVELPHIRAAFALWSYCADSVAYIFADRLGNDVTDRLLAAARDAWPNGLDGTTQDKLFSKNLKAGQLLGARRELIDRGLASDSPLAKGRGQLGRPGLMLYALPRTEKTDLTEKIPVVESGDLINPFNPSSPSTVNGAHPGKTEVFRI